MSEFACRLLNYMDDNGFDAVVVEHPGSDVNERPFMEFTPGYVLRAIDELPKQGDRTPWRLNQNYLRDIRLIRRGKIADEGLRFAKKPAAVIGLDDDDAVVVAVGDFARHERHAAQADLDVALPGPGLGALAGVGAQRLDADVDAAQRGGVTHRAVDHQARPSRWSEPVRR